jgi:transposase
LELCHFVFQISLNTLEDDVAFHEISLMDIFELIRRWHSGHGIRLISRTLGYDRKTVQRYIRLAGARGLSRGEPLPPKEEVLRLLDEPEVPLGRLPSAQTILDPYLTEIIQLVNHDEHALKPKIAFEVISEGHNLSGRVSYSSFKRFIRTHDIALHPERLTCRIDVEPGDHVQIDYALICLHFDPEEGRKRRLYAFIATLAHSRHKYIEFAYKQDQMSFVASHVRMFAYFGGVPASSKTDNLKNSVLKPDLYDPKLNRTYAALAEHYGIFIDPCRVGAPKDKGIVEADVKSARQEGRKLIVQHPTASLGELNRLVLQWCCREYGGRPHGTTHEKPYQVFQEREKRALKALPERPFEMVEWKQAKVHPDCFVQFHGNTYTIPYAYASKTVWICATEHLLKALYNDQVIKQHVITGRRRTTDYADFPPNAQAVLDANTVQRSLLRRAETIGPDFHRLIHSLLEIHAFLNLRRALGLTTLAEQIGDVSLVERAARFMSDHAMRATPHEFRLLIEKIHTEDAAHTPLPLSEATREFVRDASYFIK